METSDARKRRQEQGHTFSQPIEPHRINNVLALRQDLVEARAVAAATRRTLDDLQRLVARWEGAFAQREERGADLTVPLGWVIREFKTVLRGDDERP